MTDLTREQIERGLALLKMLPGKPVDLASGVSLEQLNALDWFMSRGFALCDMALRRESAERERDEARRERDGYRTLAGRRAVEICETQARVSALEAALHNLADAVKTLGLHQPVQAASDPIDRALWEVQQLLAPAPDRHADPRS